MKVTSTVYRSLPLASAISPSNFTRGRATALLELLGSADGRRELARELEAILFCHALDAHWPATADREYGGYLTDLDQRWRPCGEQSKSLEFQARQTWAYARAAQLYPGRGYDGAAQHGFEFLRRAMWDDDHGGFFTLVDRQGRPLKQGRKHPHGCTYAIEAFLELSPLIGDAETRLWAGRAFDWLEAVAWDREHGGYWGDYTRAGIRIDPDDLSPEDRYDWLGTPYGLKDMNVPGDALGALGALVRYGWGERAVARLEWLYRHYVDRLVTPYGLMSYFYTRDWTPLPDIPRSGHPLQLIETLISAAGPLDRTAEAICVAEKLVRRYRSFFAHAEGGLIFARSIQPSPFYDIDLSVRERTWWVQTEASRAFLLLALLCPDDPSHREAFAGQWSFVEGHMVDTRFHGFFESAEEGRKARQWLSPFHSSSRKTHLWKDVSHEAHMLMDAVGWLRGGLLRIRSTGGTSGRQDSQRGKPSRDPCGSDHEDPVHDQSEGGASSGAHDPDSGAVPGG